MTLIVATTSLPFNCLMATNCKAASHAPFIYVFNIGVISNNTNRLWREFSIKQITEIVINIFLTTKERQSIRTIHYVIQVAQGGDHCIVMVIQILTWGGGGLVVPQRIEKYLYNCARSIITKFNHKRVKLAILQSEWEIVWPVICHWNEKCHNIFDNKPCFNIISHTLLNYAIISCHNKTNKIDEISLKS